MGHEFFPRTDMIELIESTEASIRHEIFRFSNPIETEYFGEIEEWNRVEVDGELARWVPRDEYGDLPQAKASEETEEILESKYQNSYET